MHSLQAQTYRSHKVEKGETITSIAEKYKVSEASILQLNPDLRKGISANSILIIPATPAQEERQIIGFKNHRVKRKETLYSISKDYGVEIDDIKKENKFLYSSELKKGDKIKIPQFGAPMVIIEGPKESEEGNTSMVNKNHEVQPKETWYGLARKYGVSIVELQKLNPELRESLPIGTMLKVPGNEVVDSAVIEEDLYEFYEVQPKEGFYRLKVKLGLSEETIVELNPYAKDGLKEGMILKVPKRQEGADWNLANVVDLSNSIANPSKKKIALFLPFVLKNYQADSLKLNEELLQHNRTLRIALDFYSGVLMATEFAKDKGISVDLQVFDTEGSSGTLMRILRETDLSEMDAVIGPLLSKNVELAASQLKSDDVPVFSPLSNRSIKLTSNLFQTLPDDQLLERAMLYYLKENAVGKNMVMITDHKDTSKENITEAIPSIKMLSPKERGFLYVADVHSKLIDNQENWVLLESSNPILISNAIGLLNGMPSTYQIRLFTTHRNEGFEYDDIANTHLANLQFTFPSVSKTYSIDEQNAFLVSYKNQYGVYPNRYAVRGFDLAFDILLRLGNGKTIYDSMDNTLETEYIENKFRYDKKMFSGYENQSFYILKYNADLSLDVLK